VRFIALFLSIIVFTLTISPCCALGDSKRPAEESTLKEQKECDKQSGDCNKGCSPFYVCGTCTGFTLTKQHVVTLTIPIQTVKHDTAYIPFKLPLIPLAIWQPPKLS
jgi:hypothetical protein